MELAVALLHGMLPPIAQDLHLEHLQKQAQQCQIQPPLPRGTVPSRAATPGLAQRIEAPTNQWEGW